MNWLKTDSPIIGIILPDSTGKFMLEYDSSEHVGSVLYQLENSIRKVIAFFSAVMPHAACRYSSSEIELCGLKKSILHFQNLTKYAHFTVIMDHKCFKNDILL